MHAEEQGTPLVRVPIHFLDRTLGQEARSGSTWVGVG